MDSAAFWMTGFRTAASAGLGNRQRCGPHTGQHSGGQHEKRHPGECLFYLYVIASRLGEDAAILEGI